MCRIRAFPRVHCFSYLFLSSVALWKSYCCLFTGVEERICAREVVFCVYVHVCVYVRALALMCVCVWSSRFVNYIGPNQTCYTHTRMFYSLLNSSLFFLLFYIFFTYTRAYIFVCTSPNVFCPNADFDPYLFLFSTTVVNIYIYMIYIYTYSKFDWETIDRIGGIGGTSTNTHSLI